MIVYGITFDHTTNYGSCFQAYALQTVIEKISVGGTDWENCSYQLIPIKTLEKFPVGNKLKNVLVKPALKFHRLRFEKFENKYMKFADVDCLGQLGNLNQKGDAFVCGSDVIWNPDFNYGLGAFYLDFAEKYKFSYAASFGKAEIKASDLCKIQNYLKSFDAISVREKTGADIINCCTGINAKVVADPILLLDREVWSQVASAHRIHDQKPYIFVYTTHLNDTIKSFVSRLKKQTGLNVIRAAYGPKQAIKQGILQVQTPERWLQLLRDAEYVVTNSYHATVFSVLFHKKFFTVVQGGKGTGINIRMRDFLKEAVLEGRIYSTVPDHIETEDIDYRETDKRIDFLRKESIAFLRENLEEAYRQKINVPHTPESEQ